MQRLTKLDAIRGGAAVLVVISHSLSALGGLPLALVSHVWSPGVFGVALFFCLSGAVIPPARMRAENDRVFWLRRIFRLFPAYWIAVAASAFTSAPSLETTLINLTMLQGFVSVPHVNTVFWTLTIELIFYTLVSGLASAGLLERPLIWTGALLILAALTGGIAPMSLAVIGCGALLRVPSRAGLLLCALTALLWLARRPDLSTGIRLGMASGIGVYALLMRVPWSPAIPLRWLGDISYGVYLLHMPVLWSVPAGESAGLTIARWLGVTLTAAALLHIAIERPMMRLGARLTRRCGESQSQPARWRWRSCESRFWRR